MKRSRVALGLILGSLAGLLAATGKINPPLLAGSTQYGSMLLVPCGLRVAATNQSQRASRWLDPDCDCGYWSHDYPAEQPSSDAWHDDCLWPACDDEDCDPYPYECDLASPAPRGGRSLVAIVDDARHSAGLQTVIELNEANDGLGDRPAPAAETARSGGVAALAGAMRLPGFSMPRHAPGLVVLDPMLAPGGPAMLGKSRIAPIRLSRLGGFGERVVERLVLEPTARIARLLWIAREATARAIDPPSGGAEAVAAADGDATSPREVRRPQDGVGR